MGPDKTTDSPFCTCTGKKKRAKHIKEKKLMIWVLIGSMAFSADSLPLLSDWDENQKKLTNFHSLTGSIALLIYCSSSLVSWSYVSISHIKTIDS